MYEYLISIQLLILFFLLFRLRMSQYFDWFGPEGLYVFFNIFYIIGLVFYSQFEFIGIGKVVASEIIQRIVSSSILGLIAFCLIYDFFSDRKKGIGYNYSDAVINIQFSLFVYISVFLLLVNFANDYGWHTYSRLMFEDGAEGAGFTIYAYVKYFFICFGLLFFYVSNVGKLLRIFVFATQIALTLVDGGRTTFLGFIMAIYMLSTSRGYINTRYAIVFAFLILSILLVTRALSIDGAFIEVVLGSVFFESAYSLISTIQIYEALEDGRIAYLYGATYIWDAMVYLLPSDIRVNYLMFSSAVAGIERVEKYSPFGGFYYVGEAYLNFGFLGAVFVSAIWAYVLVAVQTSSPRMDYIKIAFISTMGTIFVKQNFANGVKLFIVYSILISILRLMFVHRKNHACIS